MSLSTAFNVISSSFAANASQTATVSNNIANVNTPGYSREIANVVTNSYGGSDVASITREANAALLEQVSSSTSQAAAQQAISDGLTTLAQTVDDSSSTTSTSGANQNGASPSAMLANLQSALTTYADSPSSSSAADAVVSAASDLASSLNSASATVQQVRETADQNMASSVGTINSLLNQFTAANNAVVTGLQTGANVSSAEDTRELDRDPARPAGRRFDHRGRQWLGVDLHGQRRHPVPGYAAHGLVHRDSDAGRWRERRRGHRRRRADHRRRIRRCPFSRARSPVMQRYGIRSRPNIRLSSTRSRAASSTPSAKAISPRPQRCPRCRACSPRRERPACPRCRRPRVSLRRSRSIRTSIPRRGAIRNLLRDGGISDPGNPAYTYNTTGAASYTGRIQELIAGISATQSFDPSAGLDSSASLTDYANASVSWLQAQNQQASDASSYQNAVATQATSALSNATGVNLDAEMTNMLNLENSYASTAKLLTTVSSMFTALLQAA